MVKEYGLVIYSDEVMIESVKYRIMVLEEGVACVRIRISQKTKKEKFVEHYFHIPSRDIELLENDNYPKKLKVSRFTLCFLTTRKKKQFIESIRIQCKTKSIINVSN